MFILWYAMSLVCILLSILLHDNFELFKFVIGFGFLGAFDMLICNIIIRLKKQTDYEEWTMKFNDRMSNM